MKRFLLLLFLFPAVAFGQTTLTKTSVVRGGQKGTTNSNADITHTASGSNHEALDVVLYDANGNALPLPSSLDGSGNLKIHEQGTATVAGTVTANAGSGTFNIQSNASVNETQVGGTAIDVNSGNKSAGTQRFVLATDQPQLTNALKVDGSAVTQPVSGTVTANQGGNWTMRLQGNAGAILDFAGQNASSPANAILIGAQFNTSPTTITSGNSSPLQVDANGNLKVNVSAGGASGGTSSSFGAAFPGTGTSAGFSDGTNMQGARVFDLDSGAGTQYGVGVTLRKIASGGSVEAGTSTDPLRVDPTGTTTQPVSGTVTANAGSGTFNIQSNASMNEAQVGGTAIDTNSGNKSAGTQRFVIATDQPQLTNALKVDGSAVTQPVSGTFWQATQPVSVADGSNTTLGAKADAKSTATDTTAVSAISILKEISAMEQAPASRAVTGTFWQATQPVSGTFWQSTQPVSIADGSNTTLGAKADAKSTATDTTSVSAMQVLKQISASVQAPPSQAVTNAGTFAAQATLQTQTDTVMVGGVNVKEINGVTPLMGAGNTGTGSPRVTIASDQVAIPVTPAATENYLGFVGGKATIVSANFTRPADTTAYASGDLVANSTTAGSVTPLSFTISRINDASGMIRRVILKKSGTTTTNANFRLHLYRSDPSTSSGIANGDNGAWSTNFSNWLGDVDLDMTSATNGRAFRDSASAENSPAVGTELNFIPNSGTQTIYGLLEARAAYTPGNAEVFTVYLETLQN